MPTTTVAPPPDAVALDAHWAAKMARLRARQLPETVLRVCDDEKVKKAWKAATDRADLARRAAEDNPKDRPARLEHAAADKALAAAQAAYDEASIMLRFRALPRPALEALFKAHPATEEQQEDGSDWNPDTFPAALIAAASVDGMTPEEARELLDTWSQAEANALFWAAMGAQQEQRTDLGKG